jgi:nucleotide-binding universal stress UspA family protein
MRVIHTVDQLIGARQPDPLDTMDKSEDMLAREAYDEERSEAQRYLEAARESLGITPEGVRLVVTEGNPVDEILRVTNEAAASLIVLTAYGLSASKSPTKTDVFGGVADGILKRARTPVLVVKPW